MSAHCQGVVLVLVEQPSERLRRVVGVLLAELRRSEAEQRVRHKLTLGRVLNHPAMMFGRVLVFAGGIVELAEPKVRTIEYAALGKLGQQALQSRFGGLQIAQTARASDSPSSVSSA